MKKRVRLFIIIMVVFLLIPIFSNAITREQLEIGNFLESYNSNKNKLAYSLISIISIDCIVSLVTVIINKKRKKSHYYKYLILLFEVTSLIYFISVIYIIRWTEASRYLGASESIIYFCILLNLVSSIIQFITIRCNSKTKKQLFIMFEVLGVLAILGNFAFGVWSINNLSNKYDKYRKVQSEFYVGKIITQEH